MKKLLVIITAITILLSFPVLGIASETKVDPYEKQKVELNFDKNDIFLQQ